MLEEDVAENGVNGFCHSEDALPTPVAEEKQPSASHTAPKPKRVYRSKKKAKLADSVDSIDSTPETENDTNSQEKSLKRSSKQQNSKKKSFGNREFDRPNPLTPVVISDSAAFSDTNMIFSPSKMAVSNEKGYRLCKATHGVDRAGTWFFEAIIPADAAGFFRIGWAQILAEPHAPVGYDEYSYSYASKTGNAFHVSRGFHYAETYGPGDVIGCLLHIPPIPGDQDAFDEETNENLLQKVQEKHPPLKEGIFNVTLNVRAGSYVAFFKNGQYLGKSHEDLYDAKYYPSFSIYKGGPVEANFGPFFKFPPSGFEGCVEPVSSLFDPTMVMDDKNTLSLAVNPNEMLQESPTEEQSPQTNAPLEESEHQQSEVTPPTDP